MAEIKQTLQKFTELFTVKSKAYDALPPALSGDDSFSQFLSNWNQTGDSSDLVLTMSLPSFTTDSKWRHKNQNAVLKSLLGNQKLNPFPAAKRNSDSEHSEKRNNTSTCEGERYEEKAQTKISAEEATGTNDMTISQSFAETMGKPVTYTSAPSIPSTDIANAPYVLHSNIKQALKAMIEHRLQFYMSTLILRSIQKNRGQVLLPASRILASSPLSYSSPASPSQSVENSKDKTNSTKKNPPQDNIQHHEQINHNDAQVASKYVLRRVSDSSSDSSNPGTRINNSKDLKNTSLKLTKSNPSTGTSNQKTLFKPPTLLSSVSSLKDNDEEKDPESVQDNNEEISSTNNGTANKYHKSCVQIMAQNQMENRYFFRYQDFETSFNVCQKDDDTIPPASKKSSSQVDMTSKSCNLPISFNISATLFIGSSVQENNSNLLEVNVITPGSIKATFHDESLKSIKHVNVDVNIDMLILSLNEQVRFGIQQAIRNFIQNQKKKENANTTSTRDSKPSSFSASKNADGRPKKRTSIFQCENFVLEKDALYRNGNSASTSRRNSQSSLKRSHSESDDSKGNKINTDSKRKKLEKSSSYDSKLPYSNSRSQMFSNSATDGLNDMDLFQNDSNRRRSSAPYASMAAAVDLTRIDDIENSIRNMQGSSDICSALRRNSSLNSLSDVLRIAEMGGLNMSNPLGAVADHIWSGQMDGDRNRRVSFASDTSDPAFTAEIIRRLELEIARRNSNTGVGNSPMASASEVLRQMEMEAAIRRSSTGGTNGSMASAAELVRQMDMEASRRRSSTGGPNSSMASAADLIRQLEMETARRRSSAGGPNSSMTSAADLIRLLELETFLRRSSTDGPNSSMAAAAELVRQMEMEAARRRSRTGGQHSSMASAADLIRQMEMEAARRRSSTGGPNSSMASAAELVRQMEMNNSSPEMNEGLLRALMQQNGDRNALYSSALRQGNAQTSSMNNYRISNDMLSSSSLNPSLSMRNNQLQTNSGSNNNNYNGQSYSGIADLVRFKG